MYKKLLFFCCFVTFLCNQLNAQGKYLETIKITDSIYVFKPKIDWVHGNGVAIIGKDGVFFIDTYIQTNYAEEAMARLKQITKLPIKYILNTHSHGDHTVGNYTFKKAFPNAQIIMNDSAYAEMVVDIKPLIPKELESTKAGIEQLEKELKDEKIGTGYPITGSMKNFWALMIQESKEYVKAYKGNKFIDADITFSDTLTYHWGSQTIMMISTKDNGHSPGDVLVWIPEKKIMITGDIVVGPTPYAIWFNIPGIMTTIQKVIDMNPSVIIPGHGPVEYDLNYITQVKEAFTTYRKEIEKAIANKVALKDAMKNIRFPDIDNKFTGDDDTKKWAYKTFFLGWIIRNMYKLKG
jgi:cyclase